MGQALDSREHSGTFRPVFGSGSNIRFAYRLSATLIVRLLQSRLVDQPLSLGRRHPVHSLGMEQRRAAV